MFISRRRGWEIPEHQVTPEHLFFNRRQYFVEHAVVATHLWSFILLLLAVVVPAVAFVLMWLFEGPSLAATLASNDMAVSTFLTTWFHRRMLRRSRLPRPARMP